MISVDACIVSDTENPLTALIFNVSFHTSEVDYGSVRFSYPLYAYICIPWFDLNVLLLKVASVEQFTRKGSTNCVDMLFVL